MRVTFGYPPENGTVISFFGVIPNEAPAFVGPNGYAVVLADYEQRGTRFVVVPLKDLKTDPPDRKWGLS